jgi:hypothetical protein
MDRETEFRRLYDAHRATLHAYFTGRTWWRQYTAGFTARMVASTRPVRRAA